MDYFEDDLEELENEEEDMSDEMSENNETDYITADECVDYVDGEKDILENLSDENIEIEDYLYEEMNEDIANEDVDGKSYLEDIPKVLTREITPEILESREADIQEQLDGYRENLEQYDVPNDKIDEFLLKEREKIELYYKNLDNGDSSSDIYYSPTNWELEANKLKGEDIELDNIMRDVLDQNVESQRLPADSKVDWSRP